MRAQMSNDLAAGLPRRPQKIFTAFFVKRLTFPPPKSTIVVSKKEGLSWLPKKDYFGLNYLVSVILAIIPVTSWVCGFVTRFMEGKILAGILRLLLGWNIIWILDLIFMIISHKIFRIIPI